LRVFVVCLPVPLSPKSESVVAVHSVVVRDEKEMEEQNHD